MFCTKCGAALRDGARFCDSCGVQLSKSPQKAVDKSHKSRWLRGILLMLFGGSCIYAGTEYVLSKSENTQIELPVSKVSENTTPQQQQIQTPQVPVSTSTPNKFIIPPLSRWQYRLLVRYETCRWESEMQLRVANGTNSKDREDESGVEHEQEIVDVSGVSETEANRAMKIESARIMAAASMETVCTNTIDALGSKLVAARYLVIESLKKNE
jgi:zinc-ribbon domain